MASMHGTPQGDFDERLAEALASALTIGEETLAKEEADQGQAIVLTDSRIILLRAGLAATGELNGSRVSAFALGKITAINLRKGPLGAVIQIVAEDSEAPSDGARPDNVVVFTGPGRVKKAEAFAAAIESATDKAVARTEPQARPEGQPVITEIVSETPRAPRARKSLAEEIYAEATGTDAACVAEPVVEIAQAQPLANPEPPVEFDLAVEEEEPEPSAPRAEFNPNPRLPRPTRKRQHGPNRLLVAMGVLASLVFVGMAVMAPLNETSDTSPVSPVVGGASNDVRLIKLQLVAATSYRSEVTHVLAKADAAGAAFRSAVRSGGSAAVVAASKSDAADRAWQKMSDLTVPPGLAEANQDIIDGLVARKNAIAAAASAGVSGSVDTTDILGRLDRADAQIRKGLVAIDAALADLRQQAAKRASTPKKRSAAN